jgi:hypothetical protein
VPPQSRRSRFLLSEFLTTVRPILLLPAISLIG